MNLSLPIGIAFALAIIGAQSWLTCPPSFNPSLDRTKGEFLGPCESIWNMDPAEEAPATVISPGQRLKVAWTSNNQAGGHVRLSMVPLEMSTLESVFDENVVKITCFGEDQRPGKTYNGVCTHPCNARGPWKAVSSQNPSVNNENQDQLRYDTSIAIPTNLQRASRRGKNGGDLYVLQLKALPFQNPQPSYSCALIEVIHNRNNRSKMCATLKSPPLAAPACKVVNNDFEKSAAADQSALDLLLQGSSMGSFCFDGSTDVDYNINEEWPVNADCDPRINCAVSFSQGKCQAEIADIPEEAVIFQRLDTIKNARQDFKISNMNKEQEQRAMFRELTEIGNAKDRPRRKSAQSDAVQMNGVKLHFSGFPSKVDKKKYHIISV